jgi:hypothetical protein
MIEIEEYKENRIKELRKRLSEINDIIGLDAVDGLAKRQDSFGERMKEKKLEVMKEFYEEMVSIKKEIAKLEGRKSIFEKLEKEG